MFCPYDRKIRMMIITVAMMIIMVMMVILMIPTGIADLVKRWH